MYTHTYIYIHYIDTFMYVCMSYRDEYVDGVVRWSLRIKACGKLRKYFDSKNEICIFNMKTAFLVDKKFLKILLVN